MAGSGLCCFQGLRLKLTPCPQHALPGWRRACSTSQICPRVRIQGGGGHRRTKQSLPQLFPNPFSALWEYVSWAEEAWDSVMFCGDRKSSVYPHVGISIGDAQIPLSLVSQNFTLFYIQCLGDMWSYSKYCHGKTILCPGGWWVSVLNLGRPFSWVWSVLHSFTDSYWVLCHAYSTHSHTFFLHYFVTTTISSFPLSKPVTAGLASWGSQILWEAVFSRSFYLFLFGVTATHDWASEGPASRRFNVVLLASK